MTKFEQIGVGLQIESETASEAVRQFAYSCRVCCTRGMRIQCDRCAISATHQQMLGVFRDVAEAESKRKKPEAARFPGVAEIVNVRLNA